jgi:AraC-like DNA-binding protein
MARHDPRNFARYWNDQATPGLSLMCAAFTTHEYAPHVHDGFVVAATEAGGAEVKSRGVIGRAQASTLFAFNPGEPHSGWMGESCEWRYRAFYLSQRAIDGITESFGTARPGYFLDNAVNDRELIEHFLKLHRALEVGADGFRSRELFLDAFATLFARYADGNPPPPAPPRDRALLATVNAIMQSRFGEQLLLDDLAHDVGLTPFQLIGLFKRTVSLTPHAYLTQVRLTRACDHLRRGEPIASAATQCGFYDQAALTHHFKRCFGITPLQFARAVT